MAKLIKMMGNIRGAVIIEYALIMALFGLVALAGAQTIGAKISAQSGHQAEI